MSSFLNENKHNGRPKDNVLTAGDLRIMPCEGTRREDEIGYIDGHK